jgi:UDP-2,3-diacylglucosamine hydrolase
MNPAVPPIAVHCAAAPWPVLQAPPHWRNVDFIADLHLQADEPATFREWQDFMQSTRADAVFILGDLFEVWVGDDVIDGATGNPDSAAGFETGCAQILKAASRRLDIFFMHGNRDFLLGPAFAGACSMNLLHDPTVLAFAGQRWLLSHGDALCLDDTDYMQFRAQVRSAQWQRDFLGQPLAQRQAIARSLRRQSETRKRSGVVYGDVDAQAACDWLQAAQATTLIHGHTHKPANHDLPRGLVTGLTTALHRIVLSDWDAAALPPRAEVLRLHLDSRHQVGTPRLQRISAALAA